LAFLVVGDKRKKKKFKSMAFNRLKKGKRKMTTDDSMRKKNSDRNVKKILEKGVLIN
jgi:hypothetical protein